MANNTFFQQCLPLLYLPGMLNYNPPVQINLHFLIQGNEH